MDDILDAFTGDMAFTLNKLSISDKQAGKNAGDDYGYQESTRTYDMCYVLKINKKENFRKILNFAVVAGLQPTSTGYVMPLSLQDSLFIAVNDQYAVFSNKNATAIATLNGGNKEKIAENILAQATSHPMTMFFDINQTLKNIDLSNTMSSPGDSSMYAESRRLLSNISLNGGEFKDNAMQAHLDVNFTNTEENSIITLLDFGMKINDAREKYTPAPASQPAANAAF